MQERNGSVSDSNGSGRKAAKIAFIAFCLAGSILLTALALIDPSSGAMAKFELCPFHAWTGFSCAGCGSTRAAHELLNGRLLQALAYNPLTTMLSPFAAYLLVCWGVKAFTGRTLPLPKRKLSIVIGLIVTVLAFAVARNIPSNPFKALAPHALQADSKEISK